MAVRVLSKSLSYVLTSTRNYKLINWHCCISMTAFWEGGEIEFLRDNFQWRSAPDLHLAPPPGRNPEYALGNLIFLNIWFVVLLNLQQNLFPRMCRHSFTVCFCVYNTIFLHIQIVLFHSSNVYLIKRQLCRYLS